MVGTASERMGDSMDHPQRLVAITMAQATGQIVSRGLQVPSGYVKIAIENGHL
jgi:hypothetical protein